MELGWSRPLTTVLTPRFGSTTVGPPCALTVEVPVPTESAIPIRIAAAKIGRITRFT